MENSAYTVETLVALLGLSRGDQKVQMFVRQFGALPIETVYKQDGTDYEFVEFKPQGFGFGFENNKLIAISLYSPENDSNYSRYPCPLPLGICFECSKQEISCLLGNPEAEGRGKDGDFGLSPLWLRYKIGNCKLHVEFTKNSKSIRVMTLMA